MRPVFFLPSSFFRPSPHPGILSQPLLTISLSPHTQLFSIWGPAQILHASHLHIPFWLNKLSKPFSISPLALVICRCAFCHWPIFLPKTVQLCEMRFHIMVPICSSISRILQVETLWLSLGIPAFNAVPHRKKLLKYLLGVCKINSSCTGKAISVDNSAAKERRGVVAIHYTWHQNLFRKGLYVFNIISA